MSTTPAGTITASDVQTALNGGISTNYPNANSVMTFNDVLVRALAGKPTAATPISMDNMRNKAGPAASGTVLSSYCSGSNLVQNIADGKYGSTTVTTVNSPSCVLVVGGASGDIQNLNIYDAAVAAGWNTSSPLEYVIPAGKYIWSDSTSLPALTTGGAFPGGLKIINKGFIMGKGGAGAGANTSASSYDNATDGGTAINLTTPVTIDNREGYIGGGGGGGGALRYFAYNSTAIIAGGGGAGGGAGGRGGDGSTTYGMSLSTYTAGGAIGQAGANGARDPSKINPGGGAGGRIMPGTGGSGGTNTTFAVDFFAGKGGGSGGGGALHSKGQKGSGGNGGSAGDVGGIGTSTAKDTNAAIFRAGGGGGGWGATGGNGVHYDATTQGGYTVDLSVLLATAGGAGGKAVNTNNNSITWTGGFDVNRVFGRTS
jgi:hypothetical protein